VCTAEIAGRQRRRDRSLDFGSAQPGRATTDHAGQVELELLLDGLELARRTAFVLTQIIGCSYEEAAQVCECPIGTIRSRVARARNDLLEAMNPRTTADGPLPRPVNRTN
jgi:RNA polymerase sigma-70 factor, ECF subfamily